MRRQNRTLHAALETTNEDYQIRQAEKKCFAFFVSAGDAGMTPVERLSVIAFRFPLLSG
ncbi:hypothetical protein SAMN05192539_10217 [Paraburkholderia diazotrophica]|uniref:Uncharacterized protein n=2 Tax=Paraburkholderia diazotrophica TaxID=667676 RepID=A0A1H7C927_9BURK|nr:hypothetical protein SAMN05192539_10217 [Paraburkholderia diazotrophica]